MKNVFDQGDVKSIISRIDNLTPESQPLWGKMSVGQMFAHCNVTYESELDKAHPEPSGLTKLMLKLFVKSMVTSKKPYKKNLRTAGQFLITDSKDFEAEKIRLINYIHKTQQLGVTHFENKTSHSFGKLSTTQWNNLFSKHLDHHLSQFGV